MVEPSLSESEISEIKSLWQSSFVSKCSKFDVNSGNETKKSEEIVGFKYISILIGDDKFPHS